MHSPRSMAALAAAALSLSSTARASDFVDTRLSFAVSDDNVLAGAGETTPSSPNAHIGAGAQNNQFYDNVNTRYSGFETMSFLTLYKSTPTFFEGLFGDAAFTVRLLQKPGGTLEFRDNSSYVRLWYTPAGWGPKENISLTGFPVDADRMRLGYAYRITWGGTNTFHTGGAKNGAPGVKLQVTRDTWYAYVGAKTSLILNPLINEEETNYGVMGGAGWDITPFLRVEGGAGWFQKGLNPGLADVFIRAPVTAAGASGQVVWHVGEQVGQSVDLRLYRNDPDMANRIFSPEKYPGGLSYTVSLEGSYLAQTLADPDIFGRTVVQGAQAAVAMARMKYDFMRVHMTAFYRTPSFLQFNTPGFPPFQDFADGTKLQPEIFVAVGADYHLPTLRLTPGFIVGVQQPTAFTGPTYPGGGNNPPSGLLGPRTVVLRDGLTPSVLPSGYDTVLIYSAKATTRWDISETLAGVAELYYTRDANRVTFKDDTFGVSQPTFDKEDGLGFNLVVQARF